jgi:hypothetical protein
MSLEENVQNIYFGHVFLKHVNVLQHMIFLVKISSLLS